jgi:hypothetical protein
MSNYFIKDADAAVTAIDCFVSFCSSAAEGNMVKAAFDVVSLAAAIKQSII